MADASIRYESIQIRRPWFDAFPVRSGAAVATLVILAASALLLWRRLGGDAHASLPPGMLFATAAFAAVIVIGGRLLWREVSGEVGRSEGRTVSRFIDLGGTTALVLFAVGCSYPGDRTLDWLAWAPAIGLDAWIRYGFRRQPATPMARRSHGLANTEAAIHDLAPRPNDLLATLEKQGSLDETLLQDVRRTRTKDGIETVCASLRAEFVASQRHALLHVGFCPPLSHLPEVNARTSQGPAAEVRVVQAFAHGASLEVRLSKPAEEACSVLVELSATPRL